MSSDGRIPKDTSEHLQISDSDIEILSKPSAKILKELDTSDPLVYSLATKSEIVASDSRDYRKGDLDICKYLIWFTNL